MKITRFKLYMDSHESVATSRVFFIHDHAWTFPLLFLCHYTGFFQGARYKGKQDRCGAKEKPKNEQVAYGKVTYMRCWCVLNEFTNHVFQFAV